MNIQTQQYLVKEKQIVELANFPSKPAIQAQKNDYKEAIKETVKEIDSLQNILYAENKRALVIVMQGMDAAGKDSAIRAIMTGVNPQGVDVISFKKPTSTELEHDYLWRHYIHLPEKGKISIFNRSHYENVLVTKVHPEYLLSENLYNINKPEDVTPIFWEKRYEQILHFEKTLAENGYKIIKLMLHVSKEEQKIRFIERIENKEKNWKFSSQDIKERKYWNEYQKCYEELLSKTSTEESPWYIIPCDDKKFAQLTMATVVKETLQNMNLQFPDLDAEEEAKLQQSYQELLSE